MNNRNDYSCLEWKDDNGYTHVMRGWPEDLAEHVENIALIGYEYKVYTFAQQEGEQA